MGMASICCFKVDCASIIICDHVSSAETALN
jgi:hypothetical protein